MKNKPENEGVTLIALVITIIVLLVLAGVSVSAIVGDNGILTRATTVEEEYSKSEIDEQLQLIINQELVDAYKDVSGTSNDISTVFNEEILIDYLTNPDGDDSTDDGYISADTTSSTVSDVLGNTTVYTKYYINVENLSSNVDSIGIGSSDENVFTLEVITEEKTDDDGNTSTVSTGKYELKYYDKNGNAETLSTIWLYASNNS